MESDERRLASQWPEEVIEVLIRLLRDPIDRDEASHGLWLSGPRALPALPTIIELIEHRGFGDEDLYLLWIPGSIGPEAQAAIPALARAIRDDEPSIRAAAARSLGGVRGRSDLSVPALVSALRDPEYQVRWDAGEALQRFGEEAVPWLADALSVGDARSRWETARVLAGIGRTASAAVPALLDGLADVDGDVREAMAHGLKYVGVRAEDVSEVLARLDDERPAVRGALLSALGESQPRAEGVVPELVRRLREDPSMGAQQAARLGLLRIPKDLVLPYVQEFVELLRDTRDDVRQSAVDLLGHLHADVSLVLPALTTALGDPNSSVRFHAIQAIRMYGDDAGPAVPMVAARLNDESPSVRSEAARLLGQLGTVAACALPALKAKHEASDEDDDVREQVDSALGSIQEIE